jgi:hypothetical protein
VTITITTSGLADFKKYCDVAPDIAVTSARIALNTVAARALKQDVPKTMRGEVAFPPGYLEDPTRLARDRPATNTELFTSIIGQDPPTSLARFANGLAAFGTKQEADVIVIVKPSRSVTMKRVFPFKLRAGDGTSGAFNIGLAIRLKPGEILAHRTLGNIGLAIPRIPNVYLLYGPSVNQVFDDVAGDLADPLGESVEAEFLRQFLFRSQEFLQSGGE